MKRTAGLRCTACYLLCAFNLLPRCLPLNSLLCDPTKERAHCIDDVFEGSDVDRYSHWESSSSLISQSSYTRRRILLDSAARATGAILAGSALFLPAKTQASYSEPNINCLLELPPPRPDIVRVYLCRHGETENNRLRLFQGVRVNAPLNGRGVAQSERLGLSLSRLHRQLRPTIAVHSGLIRSTQTSIEAVKAMKHAAALRDGDGLGPRRVGLERLTSLKSIDYGPFAGGREASEVYATVSRTYGAWTAGYLDARPDGGGETGREVLRRAASALMTLMKIGRGMTAVGGGARSILAVSHSSYIRVLLAIVLGMPLEEAATLSQDNACFNVIDLCCDNEPIILGAKSTLFYEKPKNFELRVPMGRVVRINEVRHLGDICRFIPRT